jgi:uncharacterized membrane protein YfcA
MLTFSGPGWIIAAFCALLVGLSKTGLPGAGVLAVPLLASVMPARESTGFLLPLLIAADILAIIYWRRSVDWPKLARLLPWTLAGVVAGYFGLRHVTSRQLMPLIGLIVLVMLGINWWRNTRSIDPVEDRRIPTSWGFAALVGVIAGVTSMMANAAGPVMVVYMLAMKMEKKHLIGTTAWFFWILNLSKIPFSGNLDLINAQSLMTDLFFLPCILAGGIAGIFLVHRMPKRLFNRILELLAAGAALILCLKAFL